MRRFTDETTGASEIIGVLLLVLIVITAASAFAVFVNSQQQEIQQQQRLDLEREQEALSIIALHPVEKSGVSEWQTLNITIASLHTRYSEIGSLRINDHPVKSFTLWSVNTSTGYLEPTAYTYSDTLSVSAREVITLEIDTSIDFFESNVSLPTDQPLKIEFFTGRLNSISESFNPPSAIIAVQTESLWNASSASYSDYLILDGSSSVAMDDSYLVQWEWSIVNGTGVAVTMPDSTGKKVRIDPLVSDVYTITLTVRDNNNMIGYDAITYYA